MGAKCLTNAVVFTYLNSVHEFIRDGNFANDL